MSRARSAMHVFTDTDQCAEKLFHAWTRLQKKSADMIPEKELYSAGMTEFDGHFGMMLKTLEERGIANNTIVIITSSNSSIIQSKLALL